MTAGKPYFENLDGLRFMAFFAVFISHGFAFSKYRVDAPVATNFVDRFLSNGDLGVSFFFVLSGFLITTLLLNEKKQQGTISIKKFYMRRILRIWPVYFLTIALGFFIIPFLLRTANQTDFLFAVNIPIEQLPWYVLFGANFNIINTGTSFLLVAVLWSVSVEEQFYLLWPLLNKAVSKKGLLMVIGALIVFSFYYRLVNYQNSYILEYSTFSVISDLAIGSFFAACNFLSERFMVFFKRLPKWKIATLYVLLFLCVAFRLSVFELATPIQKYVIAAEPLVITVLFACVVMEQNYSQHSLFKMSRFALVSYLGKISYGLYCYHMIALFFVALLFGKLFGAQLADSFWLFLTQMLVTLVLTVLFSALSFKSLESKFLLWKEKYNL